MDLPGTHCQEFKSANADGYLCTCNTSNCNTIEKGKEMITRAESGIVGDGIECHVCTGNGGICSGESDAGSIINCGEGVETCLLATGRSVDSQINFRL